MEWNKTLEQLFKFAPTMVGFLMEQKLSFIIIIVAVIAPVFVYYNLSENQYQRVQNNPKNVTAAIIVLIILLLIFSLCVVFSHQDEKKTEPLGSTAMQALTENNKEFMGMINRLLKDMEGNTEFRNKAMEYQRNLHETALLLTRENEKCKTQLKACEENLHVGANQ